MAALDVITRILKPGQEVIAGDDIYGGTNRLLTYLRTHMGVAVHHVDTTDPASILPYLNPGKTAMVLLETPTNPLLKIVDIARISAMVKEKCEDAIVVVDNTMMSPYLQRPLEHGADIVYDSATKYLSGHHDLMAGVITCNRDDLAKVGDLSRSKTAFVLDTTNIFLANGLHYQCSRQCPDTVRLVLIVERDEDARYPYGPSAIHCYARCPNAFKAGVCDTLPWTARPSWQGNSRAYRGWFVPS